MLRWMSPRYKGSKVTEDPLAAIDIGCKDQEVYSVSRTNPIYIDAYRESIRLWQKDKAGQNAERFFRQSTPSGEKSSSSGYGGSQIYSTGDPLYIDMLKLKEDAISVLEQNSNYVRSIKVASRRSKATNSSGSSSTLNAIPEGRIDFTIPRPIWPKKCKNNLELDSLIDETVLLYTSLSYKPDAVKTIGGDLSLRDVLIDLLQSINTTIEKKNGAATEEVLQSVNEKIVLSLEALRHATEEEIRLFCVNLRNSRNVNTVMRAFSNASSNSSQSAPEWRQSDIEDVYQVPSDASTFTDAVKFHDENFLSAKGRDVATKTSLLQAYSDSKPSVWAQYYGVNLTKEMMSDLGGYKPKPTDVPVFPGGRPEADFTLDVPRSELLSKRMKKDKRWRCRCRFLTTLLGLVFFVLSVMAVSLMLTRGRRMFGSMV